MFAHGCAALLFALTGSSAARSSSGGAAHVEPVLAPFSAHYTADWKSINVGTSDLQLRPDAVPNGYVYSWTMTARGIFRLVYSDDVIQRSWFTVVDGRVRPDRYRADQGASSLQIDFDWAGGRARGLSERKPVDLNLADGTEDILSIQIEVMLDLQSGTLPDKFLILDKDEIKDFHYALEGPARIRTALGPLDTVVVASRRPGSNRVLRMWFAPALGYVPVQAERSRDGKIEFGMRIKSWAK